MSVDQFVNDAYREVRSWKIPSSGKIGCSLITLVMLFGIGFWIWWCNWVTVVDKHEFAFVFDRVSGKIEKIDKDGWVIRTPIRYSVHRIDLRPQQITISANQRVLNAKLVQFNPEGLETFIEWHGRSAGDDRRDLMEILKCYAFDSEEGKDCPFLTVISGVKIGQSAHGSIKLEGKVIEK